MDKMTINVTEPFAWWENGIYKVEYPVGTHDVPLACAEYAISEGLAEYEDKEQKEQTMKLEAMKNAELVEYGRGIGIDFKPNTKKEAMISAILQKEAAVDDPNGDGTGANNTGSSEGASSSGQ